MASVIEALESSVRALDSRLVAVSDAVGFPLDQIKCVFDWHISFAFQVLANHIVGGSVHRFVHEVLGLL
jgi:hypothetical protein